MHLTSPHHPMSPSSNHTSDDDSAGTRELAPFLRTLRTLLTSESDDIIRWTPDGLAFEIVDMDALSTSVLPHYFKHSKYSSFQRQLNYFHFKKWTKSLVHVCTFSNPHFTRDNPLLSLCITRKRSRKDSSAAISDAIRTTSLSRSPSFDDCDLLTDDDMEWLLYFERMDDTCAAGQSALRDEWTVMEL
ncbi:hypothetical protein H310_12475 [Aphanomyces invadans]|uniref:HSF-type DNA-binding domain-containing protein n=1 Tax=Aphanomyces invadans TaxID=157072 RepID=A0A024TJB6_9STRA|nr:hypothetical protein H310_12475 [Aphanomyces invadans]ETV93711.1 hypothetical protein H310_12475 [Aphanomyces invadans]|eukprot:XP_008877752.1 hypothetical protein H310_12475 [Aphanomyces invadans]